MSLVNVNILKNAIRVQGRLADKKRHPLGLYRRPMPRVASDPASDPRDMPRTLGIGRVVLGGWAFFGERGNPVLHTFGVVVLGAVCAAILESCSIIRGCKDYEATRESTAC